MFCLLHYKLYNKGHPLFLLQLQVLWVIRYLPETMTFAVSEICMQRAGAGRASVFSAAWKSTAPLFFAALPFKLINDASQFVGPVFLNLLLASITRSDPPRRSYGYAILMFIGLQLGCMCEAQYWQRSMRAGFRLRASLVAATYRCVP
jgi:hypothetical protein